MTIVKTTPKHVIVRFAKMNGELARVEIPYDEATTQAIASAVIDIIHAHGMSVDVGDMFTVQTN